jgi:hypothetical protein
MGRGTQLYEFLNREKIPNALEIQHRYTSLSVTDELKKFRRKWRKEHKEDLERVQELLDGFKLKD